MRPSTPHVRICIYQRFLPPDPSGAGKQAVTLARLLGDEDIDVTLLGDAGGGPLPAEIGGIPVTWIRGLPDDPTYRQVLAYWARAGHRLFSLRRSFDLLHIHSAAFEQSAAIAFGKLLRKPVLVRSSIQGEFRGLGTSRSGAIHRHLMRMVDRFVALSRRIEEEFAAAGLPPARLELIPNGVQEELYRPVDQAERRRLRTELDLPGEGLIAIFHGVFIRRKSLHWLVDVLGPHLARYDLRLVLVGGGARDEEITGYEWDLRKQIAESDFADRIIVRDFQQDVHRFLQASDLYILPSVGEGLPNALLEAMASGLVPVVARTSGTEDVVEEGLSGFLFEPRDEESFLQALGECLGRDGEQVRRTVSAAARERAERDFGIKRISRRYARLYRQMLGLEPPRAGASASPPAAARLAESDGGTAGI